MKWKRKLLFQPAEGIKPYHEWNHGSADSIYDIVFLGTFFGQRDVVYGLFDYYHYTRKGIGETHLVFYRPDNRTGSVMLSRSDPKYYYHDCVGTDILALMVCLECGLENPKEWGVE